MVNERLTNIEIVPLLPAAKRVRESDATLFTLLHDRNVKAFVEVCAINKDHANDDDGKYTLLQYACLNGLTDAVKALLENDADPNLTGHHQPAKMLPIMIAAREGFLVIVEVLVSHGNVDYCPTKEDTVLHAVLDGMNPQPEDGMNRPVHGILGGSSETRNHFGCLEYLLHNISPDLLNINAQNDKGETVLHRAIRLHEKNLIRLLLDRGAYIGTRSVSGNIMPISLIDPKTFSEYLDDCVVSEGRRPIDEDYKIIFKYGFMVPPEVRQHGLSGKGTSPSVVSETEPLIEMSLIPELRHLLKHPVLNSFLNLKWFAIQKYFWINFAFYLTFWSSLTIYVFVVYSVDNRKSKITTFLWYLSGLFCFFLFLREFFQFSVSPRKYLKEIENWLEIALLASTVTLLSCAPNSEFAAVAMLLSWIEFVLLIGRHPWFSTNVEIFKVVCSNFLKLLAWYSILILAFAFSFYLLFKDAKKSTDTGNNDACGGDNDAEFFRSPGTSIFKTVIMLTGEFDASSIPFTCHSGVSYVLFVSFIFLIAIVLFNLLNGLAVSDTQAIRSDAEIVGIVCRAQQITYIEKMATGDPLPFLNIFDWLRTCANFTHMKMFYKNINLFSHDECVHLLPNDIENSIRFSNNSIVVKCQRDHCTDWFIDIVKQAKEILTHRESREENLLEPQLERYGKRLDSIESLLKTYEGRFNSLEKTSRENETVLKEILELNKLILSYHKLQ